MKDYTEEIIIGDNMFTLILDESMTMEFCSVEKYAGVVEIRVHPIVIKIFNADNIIHFGAWKFLASSGTPDDDLEKFIKDNFTPDIIIAMISVSYNFASVMFSIMETIDRINNDSEVIRDNKYTLATMRNRMDLLKSVGIASGVEDYTKPQESRWTSSGFIAKEVDHT